MEKHYKFKTMKDAAEKSFFAEVTLADLYSGKMKIREDEKSPLEWVTFEVGEIDYDEISRTIGTKRDPLEFSDVLRMYVTSDVSGIPSWIQRRIRFSKGWSFTAGQDYDSEIRTIRKELRRIMK